MTRVMYEDVVNLDLMAETKLNFLKNYRTKLNQKIIRRKKWTNPTN